jgi:uncharacterized protein
VTHEPRTPAGAGVPSPCIDVCTMDASTGWCLGCCRTLDEIAAWGSLDDAGKRAVWKRLAARRVAQEQRRREAAAATLPRGTREDEDRSTP